MNSSPNVETRHFKELYEAEHEKNKRLLDCLNVYYKLITDIESLVETYNFPTSNTNRFYGNLQIELSRFRESETEDMIRSRDETPHGIKRCEAALRISDPIGG